MPSCPSRFVTRLHPSSPHRSPRDGKCEVHRQGWGPCQPPSDPRLGNGKGTMNSPLAILLKSPRRSGSHTPWRNPNPILIHHTRPFSMSSPNLDGLNGRQTVVVVVSAVCIVAPTIAVALRFLSRRLCRAKLWWDDYCCAIALVGPYPIQFHRAHLLMCPQILAYGPCICGIWGKGSSVLCIYRRTAHHCQMN